MDKSSFPPHRDYSRRAHRSIHLQWLVVWPLLLLVGCAATEITPLNVPEALDFQGVVRSGQQPIVGASVRVYATGGAAIGSASIALLPQSFPTDQNGSFSISGTYTCPLPDSQVYVIATGGSSGASAKSNPALALMTALGSCETLGSVPFATVNESTTVGSIWPLALYAKSGVAIGAGSADLQALEAAAATIGKLVNLADGTAPGLMLLTGEVAPTAKLQTLADVIANCAGSAGGTAGDGSSCGNLFSSTTLVDGLAPSDTLSAALAIAQNPDQNVSGIFNLVPADRAFEPTLTSPPSDWTLPILTAPAPPTISPATETVSPGQTISIAEATTGASVYYTMDGSQPSPASQPYLGPISLTSSGTVNAVGIKNSLRSTVVSRVFQVLAPLSIALNPGSVTLAAGQTQLFVPTVTGNSNTRVAWSLSPALGSISATGLYTAPGPTSSAQTVAVTATSTADPTKSATAIVTVSAAIGSDVLSVVVPAPLTFATSVGSSTALSKSVSIQDTGAAGTKLNWSISSTATWLSFSSTSGTVVAGRPQALTLTVNPVGLGVGIYNATATVSGTPGTAPQSLSITLTLNSLIGGYPVLNVERTFPSDSGMINVKTAYGARGDGVTDDTAAIQTAISHNIHGPNGAILYFPAGVYLVSSPLVYKDATQTWSSALTLQGENEATTIIKLTDRNSLYQNTSNTEDVLDLGSQSTFGNGGGNDGFDNYVFDITVDSGQGNPGAVALDFMGNNYCGLRNVTLRSSDPNHAGSIGLSMLRYAAGPCLMKNVVVNGFDYGVEAANTEYSVTFENLTLLNQGKYGVYNSGNVLSIRGLASTNHVPAVYNQSSLGLITLLQASLHGGSSSVSAIVNSGTLYARSVTTSGYLSALTNGKTSIPGTTLTEYDSGPVQSLFSSTSSSMNLPIEETPQFEDTNLDNWANVIAFGADPKGSSDSSAAIQAAIDSGATTVYLPIGKYMVNHTIFVRGNVRTISGFDSYITPSSTTFQAGTNPTPLFQIEQGTSDVTLSHLQLGNWGAYAYPGIIFVQQNSSRSVALADSAYLSIGTPGAVGYQNTVLGTGSLFVEDVSAGPWNILFPQNVFARQINPETKTTKILNNGGKLWILGLKTEGSGTNIETDNGGTTELLGGLIYPAQSVPISQSAFVINNSQVSFVYAASNYSVPASTPYSDFQVQVTEIQAGVTKSLPTQKLLSRGYGVLMPLYTTAQPIPGSKQK